MCRNVNSLGVKSEASHNSVLVIQEILILASAIETLYSLCICSVSMTRFMITNLQYLMQRVYAVHFSHSDLFYLCIFPVFVLNKAITQGWTSQVEVTAAANRMFRK